MKWIIFTRCIEDERHLLIYDIVRRCYVRIYTIETKSELLNSILFYNSKFIIEKSLDKNYIIIFAAWNYEITNFVFPSLLLSSYQIINPLYLTIRG